MCRQRSPPNDLRAQRIGFFGACFLWILSSHEQRKYRASMAQYALSNRLVAPDFTAANKHNARVARRPGSHNYSAAPPGNMIKTSKVLPMSLN
jgi:hypothetical protein